MKLFTTPLNAHLQTYLRLLDADDAAEHLTDQKHYRAAAELIDNGYATGAVNRYKGRGTHGDAYVVNFTPTMQGKLFADELRERARRGTWRWQAWNWGIRIIFGVIGWCFSVGQDVAAAWAKHIMDLC